MGTIKPRRRRQFSERWRSCVEADRLHWCAYAVSISPSDVFLKVDVEQARIDVEVEVMALAAAARGAAD
jgi:hypothetical protein